MGDRVDVGDDETYKDPALKPNGYIPNSNTSLKAAYKKAGQLGVVPKKVV